MGSITSFDIFNNAHFSTQETLFLYCIRRPNFFELG